MKLKRETKQLIVDFICVAIAAFVIFIIAFNYFNHK